MFSVRSDCFCQHELRKGGAVKSEIIILEDLHDIRIRGCFYGKIFAESGVPGERLPDRFRVFADALFVIQIERGRPCSRYLFCLFSGDVGCFFHVSSFPEIFGISCLTQVESLPPLQAVSLKQILLSGGRQSPTELNDARACGKEGAVRRTARTRRGGSLCEP